VENLNLYEYIVDTNTGFSTAREGNVNILSVLESGPFLYKLSTVFLINRYFYEKKSLRIAGFC